MGISKIKDVCCTYDNYKVSDSTILRPDVVLTCEVSVDFAKRLRK